MTKRQIALVTGASSGIGAAFATALARRGHHVVAVARRAERLAALADSSPDGITPVPLDLTSPDAVATLVERVAEIGPVDLLVGNAGRGAHGRAWEIPGDVTREVVALNVTANVELTSALLPGMVERGRGGVILVTSAGGHYPTPYLAAYGATKAFLLSYAEALACELDGTGVRAMALCPGPSATEFGDTAGMADLIAKAPGVLPPDAIVEAGLRAWDRGRTVCVPGAGNAAMTAVLSRLPRAVTRRLMAQVFRRPEPLTV